jgi:hypothetical protein
VKQLVRRGETICFAPRTLTGRRRGSKPRVARGRARLGQARVNAGWQFEVACFDLCLGVLMVLAIRGRSARTMLPALLLLGLPLGGNGEK